MRPYLSIGGTASAAVLLRPVSSVVGLGHLESPVRGREIALVRFGYVVRAAVVRKRGDFHAGELDKRERDVDGKNNNPCASRSDMPTGESVAAQALA